jgi:ubiquinone/menaquinone biosynthesis C-methylase UbiE
MEKSNRAFFEIHSGLPREGPGCFAATQRAFDMLTLPPRPKILDVGCGPGQQTMDLASMCEGEIVALDNHAPYLAEVRARAARLGFSRRVTACLGDMAKLPFPSGSFDCIWSEGAIYIIGFARGLELWRPFLKPGGFIAVSEITWLRADAPGDRY